MATLPKWTSRAMEGSSGSEDALKAISWDEFFEIFEDRKLAFLYQDRTSGGESRFNKFISR